MNPQLQHTQTAISAVCKQFSKGKRFVLTDDTVNELTHGFLPESPRLSVAPGEGSKTLDGAVRIWNFLEREKAVRNSVLINLGGGMITDLGGFAASVFKRGISVINLPTTLLGAVDAATGGKTGVNFAGLKNEIGTFASPLATIPLTSLFEFLPADEWLSGVGEVLKTALLSDEYLLIMAESEEFIVKRDSRIVEEVVRRCIQFKTAVVEEDFRESGRRKILNLGHTAGHAIEALMMERGTPMPHGVAVAHGLKSALEKSVETVGLDNKILMRYSSILEKYFPPLEIDSEGRSRLEIFMARDKKNTEIGKPQWVLLRDIGNPVVETSR